MPSRCILCQQIWKTQQWPQDWTKAILIPIPKRGNTEECANHQAITLSSHARKVMLKILHARLQHYANQEVQMSKLGLEQEEELEIKLPTFSGLQRKQGNFRKKRSISVSLTMLKPLTVWTMIKEIAP